MKKAILISKYFALSFMVFSAIIALWGVGVYFWFESQARNYISPIMTKTLSNLSERGFEKSLKLEAEEEFAVEKEQLFAELEESSEISAYVFLDENGKYVFANSDTKSGDIIQWLNFEYPANIGNEFPGRLKVYPSPEYMFNHFLSKKNTSFLALSFFAMLVLFALFAANAYTRFLIPMSDFKKIVKDLSEEKNPVIKIRSSHSAWKDAEKYLQRVVLKMTDTNASVKMLFSVSKVVSSQIEVSQILNAVTGMLLSKFSNAMCAVFLPEEDGMLKVVAKRGYSPSFTKSIKMKKGNPIVDAYISTKTTVIKDLSALDEEFYGYFKDEDIVTQMNIPLINEYGSAIGVLNVSSKSEEIFRQDIVDVIVLAQQYLSVALRNAAIYKNIVEENAKIKNEMNIMSNEIIKTNSKLVQKVKDLRSLFDMAYLASSSSDVVDVGDVIIQKIREVLGFETGALIVQKDDYQTFYLAAPSFGFSEQRLSEISFDLKTSKILSEAITKKSAIIFNDIEEIKKNMQEFYQIYNMSSAVFLHVKRANNLNAVMLCVNKFGSKISAEDVTILEHISVILGGIFERMRLYKEYTEKIEDLTIFQRLFSVIRNISDSNAVFTDIIGIAKDIFTADFCSILIYDAGQKALISQPGVYFVEGEEEKIIKVNNDDTDSVAAKVFLTGDVSILEKELETVRPALERKIKSAVIAPLAYNGEIFGVIRVASQRAGAYLQKHKDKMSVFASRAAFIIKMSRSKETAIKN